MQTLYKSLFSNYIIDGVMMDSTPADMLMECFAPEDWERIFPLAEQTVRTDTIVDETGDSDPSPLKYEFSKMEEYGRQIQEGMSGEVCNSVNIWHPHSSARVILAETVLKCLLSSKPSELEGMPLRLRMCWDCSPVGNMAALYKAVEAVSCYAFDLGLRFVDLDFIETEGAHEIYFELAEDGGRPNGAGSDSAGGRIPNEVACGGGVMIYVPFDTCPHKLGGSLFSTILGDGDEVGPEISDPDYFIDSYEVVHDLVEDGIALGGAVVGHGGLLTAVKRLLGGKYSVNMDLSGIQNTYMEEDPMRILFSEIPGVVLQIGESDRDYVDSQFLLQDIAYYPLGQPEATSGDGRKIRLSVESRDDLSRILSSLLEGQKSEDPEISNYAEGAETKL